MCEFAIERLNITYVHVYIVRVSNVKIRHLQNNLLTAVTCWTNSHLNTAAVTINSIG